MRHGDLLTVVVDGQGGGMGRGLVEAIKKKWPQLHVRAVGTNSLATAAMLRSGADDGATGENAVVFNARQADRCRVVRGDVMALPFADASYDAALAVETVYFWPDLTAGLREAARVLRPGGALLVVTEMSDPQKGAVWSHNCPGMTIYTPAQLRAALEAAGFSVTVYTKGVWTAAVGQKQN